MERWRNYSIENTPEYFDSMWAEQSSDLKNNHFDSNRPEQLAKHVKAGDKVCELGAGCWGAGQWLLEAANLTVDLYVVDFSDYALNWLKARLPGDGRLHTLKCDATRTPFFGGEFDCVMAGELIEHMEEPTQLVSEMARLCRKKGWMTVSTVDMRCEDAIRNRVKYPEHIWEFTPESLRSLFAPYGDAYYFRLGNYHMVECIKN